LGHLTRSVRIANAVVDAVPEATVLLLTGSPVAHSFALPERVDYLKLPSVVKRGPEAYAARELKLSNRRIREMRSRLILDAVDYLRPHLVLVDNVPLGMKGELREALEWLHTSSPRPRIHLTLRDVLDTPEAIRAAWRNGGIRAALMHFYDEISIFGCRQLFDAAAVYGLPLEKTRYMGYIGPTRREMLPARAAASDPHERQTVLVTVGGGGDGDELLRAAGELQRQLGSDSPYRFHLVLGPLMEAPKRRFLQRELSDVPGIILHEHIRPLTKWMPAADVVVSMGGYNTLCEVMALAQRSVVIPRVTPRQEQRIRAKILEDAGLLTMLPPDQLTPGHLARALGRALSRPPREALAQHPPLDGLAVFQDRLRTLLPRLTVRNSHRSPPPVSPGGERTSRREPKRIPLGRLNPRKPGSGSASRGLGGTFPPGPTLVGLLLPLLLGLSSLGRCAGAASPSLRGVSARLQCGHDANILNASDAEREAFETESDDAYFVVDRMEDAFLDLELQADWHLGRLAGVKWKGKTRYRRAQYFHAPIKTENDYRLMLQVRPHPSSRVRIGLGHCPQVYGRHRVDKDAAPGAPRFRAEVHKRWDASLEVEQHLSPRWTLGAEYDYSRRDYAQSFAERDRRRHGLSIDLAWQPGRFWRLELWHRFRRSLSRNEPDLGKDLSYREWAIGSELHLGPLPAGIRVDLSPQLRWRDYTSINPDDENHHGREDRIGGLFLTVERSLGARWLAGASADFWWREASLSSGETVDYDEEGAFSDQRLATHITWQWER